MAPRANEVVIRRCVCKCACVLLAGTPCSPPPLIADEGLGVYVVACCGGIGTPICDSRSAAAMMGHHEMGGKEGGRKKRKRPSWMSR
jgi:hypothetical protein